MNVCESFHIVIYIFHIVSLPITKFFRGTHSQIMASVTITDLKCIDKRRQMSVSGYIHQLESKYGYEIPKEIIIVCIIFYGNDSDEWDPECISSMMTLSDRTITGKATGGIYLGSSFGKGVIKSGIFAWKFKIESLKKRSNNQFEIRPAIGIWQVKNETDLPTKDKWFSIVMHKEGIKGYGFDPTKGRITTERGSFGARYGPPWCKVGTIIEMKLNLDDWSLTYIIDGIDYGKAFGVGKAWGIAKGQYRAVVFLCDGDSFTML